MPSTSDGLSASTGYGATIPTSGMIMQTASDTANGALSRWTGPTSQGAPTFVYSTAVRTVPTSGGMNIGGQDEAGKAQAHSLGLLQADAMARAKMQAPRPTQFVQQPMYTTRPPSFGMQQPRAPYVPKPEVRPVKPATSQPLQLQMGALVNVGLSGSRPLSNPTVPHGSKPPPDLNLQPVDSPSTPVGIPQSSLSLQL